MGDECLLGVLFEGTPLRLGDLAGTRPTSEQESPRMAEPTDKASRSSVGHQEYAGRDVTKCRREAVPSHIVSPPARSALRSAEQRLRIKCPSRSRPQTGCAGRSNRF